MGKRIKSLATAVALMSAILFLGPSTSNVKAQQGHNYGHGSQGGQHGHGNGGGHGYGGGHGHGHGGHGHEGYYGHGVYGYARGYGYGGYGAYGPYPYAGAYAPAYRLVPVFVYFPFPHWAYRRVYYTPPVVAPYAPYAPY